MQEAASLGGRWTAGPPPQLASLWPYLPQRGDEPTEVRVSITVSLPVAEIITRAAEHVHASEPMFIIGAGVAPNSKSGGSPMFGDETDAHRERHARTL